MLMNCPSKMPSILLLAANDPKLMTRVVVNYNFTSGTKFVIKKADTVRKQLLIMSGTPILAFVTKGSH